MRLGIIAPGSGGRTNPAVLRAAATGAEQVGYSSLWVPDHLLASDPVAALAAAAAVTSRLRLGVSVLVAPWYDPALLARSLTTLDVLSEGRLTVALGLGRSAARSARLERLLDELDDRWLRGPDDGRAVQRPRPPVLLAGSTLAGLDRVARRADGWHPAGLPLARLAAGWAEVLDRAARYGRPPDDLQLVVRADLGVTDHPLPAGRPVYHGSVEQIAEDVEATGLAGAHEVVLATDDGAGFDETLDAYARIAETLSTPFSR